MINLFRNVFPAVVVLALGWQSATASTWTLASGGTYATGNGSTYGNRLTYAQGGETLRVTAWANTADGPLGGFESAFLQRFSTGLGVCNRDEGSIRNCVSRGLDHQVDNVGQLELVLFLFESPQAMQSLTIDPYGTWDRDVSYWVGTVSPTATLGGLDFGDLATLGFGGRHDALNSVGGAALTVGLGGLVGNALLVGALNPADNSPDRFKMRTLVTTMAPPTVVPLPPAAWLLLSALGPLAALRRRG